MKTIKSHTINDICSQKCKRDPHKNIELLKQYQRQSSSTYIKVKFRFLVSETTTQILTPIQICLIIAIKMVKSDDQLSVSDIKNEKRTKWIECSIFKWHILHMFYK